MISFDTYIYVVFQNIYVVAQPLFRFFSDDKVETDLSNTQKLIALVMTSSSLGQHRFARWIVPLCAVSGGAILILDSDCSEELIG